MIRRILLFNNKEDKEILKTKSELVINIDEECKTLIQDLKDTLHATMGGKGISAIQIGVPKRICICSWGGKEIAMINPVITRKRGCQLYEEGCLSAPGKFKKISRAQKVWCTFTNENGEQEEIADGGRMSDIIQHELDHFEGVCLVEGEE